jgi:hypothetical protein
VIFHVEDIQSIPDSQCFPSSSSPFVFESFFKLQSIPPGPFLLRRKSSRGISRHCPPGSRYYIPTFGLALACGPKIPPCSSIRIPRLVDALNRVGLISRICRSIEPSKLPGWLQVDGGCQCITRALDMPQAQLFHRWPNMACLNNV